MRIPLPTVKRRARIEIIPLIDIVFFLLATFVMVSMSMVKNQGISVNLPASSTSKEQETKDTITITITEKGDIFLGQARFGLEEMVEHLKRIKEAQSDVKVLINGDDQAYFGKAISILDEVRKLGITKVSIRTKNKLSKAKEN